MCREDRCFVPFGAKAVEGNSKVCFLKFTFTNLLMVVSSFAYRDGHVVKIRVAEYGEVLEIKENHPPDPSLARPDSEVNPEKDTPLDFEESKDQLTEVLCKVIEY